MPGRTPQVILREVFGYESFRGDQAAIIDHAIAGGAALVDIKRAAMKKGGLGLQQQALQKVFDGTTSIEEVVRATRPPKAGAAKPAKAPPKPGKDKPSAA